ncbi:MAG: Lrp/AsnC family transcriptional regulator [Ruminococcaceae bacterium]|nr:Lrp/AsnC family transcriptional regulator [Oscillospiraceae bacterium]
MDHTDFEIIRLLRENARMKASTISSKVNLSVSAVLERIRKLEENGTIDQYTVLLNQKQLGNDLTALMEVSLEHPRYFDDFCEMICNEPSIASCYYLTGEFDFMLKIYTDSSESLELIHRMIKSMKGVQNTKTHFVLKPIKNELSVIPELPPKK